MTQRASELIDRLDLAPHPEGGFFREVYRSTSTVPSPQIDAIRSAVTDIYFLLQADQVSRLHRVRHDEIWHFYEGAPLQLVTISPDLSVRKDIVLGGVAGTPRYKHTVVGGEWQAAYSTGDYSLVGCTVAPGFDFDDFDFLTDQAEELKRILAVYPDLQRLL